MTLVIAQLTDLHIGFDVEKGAERNVDRLGRVIDAVFTLDHQDAADAADVLIANSVGGNASQVLQKIRDLLAVEA